MGLGTTKGFIGIETNQSMIMVPLLSGGNKVLAGGLG
jgi:hypothetical protein